jgi:hypothetical protein
VPHHLDLDRLSLRIQLSELSVLLPVVTSACIWPPRRRKTHKPIGFAHSKRGVKLALRGAAGHRLFAGMSFDRIKPLLTALPQYTAGTGWYVR